MNATASTNAPVLFLNHDFLPIAEISFKDAMKKIHAGKVEVRDVRDALVRSAEQDFLYPSVVRLLYYRKPFYQRHALNKKNLLLRDDYTCGYCGYQGNGRENGPQELTVEHILPKSRGGKSTWDNLVTACMRCNQRKKNRTPEEANMPLRIVPREPKGIPFRRVRKHTMPEEWTKYLNLYNKDL